MNEQTQPSTSWITLGLGDLGDYELVVVGGGAAGTAAAIVAARQGLRCLLIEPLSFLGGTGVAAQVTPWMSNHIDMGPLNTGLSKELQDKLEAANEAEGYALNPEALKVLLEQTCREAGVELLFEATVVAVERVGDRVQSLAVATRNGLCTVRADHVIDASGDAHVAHLAGVPCREGREGDQVHQPMSLRFVLGNLDLARLYDFVAREGGPDAVYRHAGLVVNGRGAYFMQRYAELDGWEQHWLDTWTIQFFEIPGRPNELWFNCPRLTGHNPFDPLDMSHAYSEGRRLINAYVTMFRRHVEGAADCYLVQSAVMMGIREGRRIVGDYTLTGEDFTERRKFADGICLNRYPIDIHNPHGKGVTLIDMAPGDWHEIPYRCLIPEGLANVLVAGRCISSDFTAQASYRIIPNCRTLGEAAGFAVWLARQAGVGLREVDGSGLRRLMIERGYLPPWAAA